MNSQSLKQQLPKLQSQKFAGMSDADVLSYVRIYYSLYHLVSTNSLAEEYGAPALYRRKITLLYRMLRKRYYKRETISEKAKLFNALYGLLYITEYTIPENLAQLYFDEAEELIGAFLYKNDNNEDCDNCAYSDKTEQYGNVYGSPEDCGQYSIMKLIVLQWYGIVAGGVKPYDLKYLKTHLDSWVDTQNPDGGWDNITEQQALQRISVLNLYSDLNGDSAYGFIVHRAYAKYCSVYDSENNEFLYDVVRDVADKDADVQKKLNEITKHLSESLSAQSIKIENTCRLIGIEIQNSLIGL